MNNRKPKNRRGKITRTKFVQQIQESETRTKKDGSKAPNPAYPGVRRVVHHIVAKYDANSLWREK